MLNNYQILNLITDDQKRAAFLEALSDDFAREFKKLTVSKSDRKRAQDLYAKNDQFFFDPSVQGLYCTAHTIYCPAGLAKIEGGRAMELFDRFRDILKREKHTRIDCYIREALAVGRAIGWKPAASDQDYYINIDGNYYAAGLVNSCYNLIADNKQDGGVEVALCPYYNNMHFLVLTSRYGSVFILPVNMRDARPEYNISFDYYMDIMRTAEEAAKIA